MKPISFTCRATLTQTPVEIAESILDVDQWSTFTGYGPLPGIVSAEFELRTPNVVGSRIRVRNTDGTEHVEEITVWSPGEAIEMRFDELPKPLARLATGLTEWWSFDERPAGTHVVRGMRIQPRRWFTRPVVWVLSWMLKGAIKRHLKSLSMASPSE